MTSEKTLAERPDAMLHADDKLKRVIGPWGLGAAAVNIAVGAGIFVVPAFVAAILGAPAIVAYFACGIAVALVLICYIEIGSFVHRSRAMFGVIWILLHSPGVEVCALSGTAAIAIAYFFGRR